VVKLIKEAVELHIEGLKEAGLRVPPPHSQAKVIDVTAA
jgi:predicted RNase H-like HicB family nuclease